MFKWTCPTCGFIASTPAQQQDHRCAVSVAPLDTVIAEIDEWLGSGGLFNPSEMNMLTTKGHRAVFGWREQLEAVATALQQREAALQALVATLKKNAQAHRNYAHARSIPFDDVGHEHNVKAHVIELNVAALEALIGAPSASETP